MLMEYNVVVKMFLVIPRPTIHHSKKLFPKLFSYFPLDDNMI